MDMNTYRRWDYFTLESRTKGELREKTYNGTKGALEKFDTFTEAYQRMISMYDAEIYNRDNHGYWYIVRHTITEYMENEEYHRNEMVQPCVAA